jgi:hypothetical protein
MEELDRAKRDKGTKRMTVADHAALPGAVHIASAAPPEITLVEPNSRCVLSMATLNA